MLDLMNTILCFYLQTNWTLYLISFFSDTLTARPNIFFAVQFGAHMCSFFFFFFPPIFFLSYFLRLFNLIYNKKNVKERKHATGGVNHIYVKKGIFLINEKYFYFCLVFKSNKSLRGYKIFLDTQDIFLFKLNWRVTLL